MAALVYNASGATSASGSGTTRSTGSITIGGEQGNAVIYVYVAYGGGAGILTSVDFASTDFGSFENSTYSASGVLEIYGIYPITAASGTINCDFDADPGDVIIGYMQFTGVDTTYPTNNTTGNVGASDTSCAATVANSFENILGHAGCIVNISSGSVSSDWTSGYSAEVGSGVSRIAFAMSYKSCTDAGSETCNFSWSPAGSWGYAGQTTTQPPFAIMHPHGVIKYPRRFA